MALYCDQTDLDALGLSVDVQTSNQIGSALVTRAIAHQSAVVEGYLSSRFPTPYSAWGDDVRVACATLVVWELLSPKIGPEDPQYQAWLTRYQQKDAWLRDVSKGLSRPVGLVSLDTTQVSDAGPGMSVSSEEVRSWPW